MAETSGEATERLGWAVAVVVAVLVVVNVVDAHVAHASLVIGPAGAAGLLAIARWAGLSWQELGLGRGTWRRGLIWAAGAIGSVAVVLTVGAALPATRDAFRDARYHLVGLEYSIVAVACGVVQDLPHRGGHDGVAEPDELALHTTVPPRRIQSGQCDRARAVVLGSGSWWCPARAHQPYAKPAFIFPEMLLYTAGRACPLVLAAAGCR
jgi:hypothetical protein